MNLFATGTLSMGAMFAILGFILSKYPPKEINGVVGYRTASSRRNQDTWMVANVYSARLLMWVGVALIFSGLVSLPLPDMGTGGLLIGYGLGLVLIVLMIVATERHLNKLFDKEGNRRENRNHPGL